MISFIVIGKNEGWKITKCFKSIFDTILYNNLKDYEVIYIDSDSIDNSIERVLEFDKIRIFKIINNPNAAIARNIGAKEANGESLFFIDGDMEIISEFLPLVYSEDAGLKNNFVSGQFINYYYTTENRYISKEKYHKNKSDKYYITTGGLFFIKKEYWQAVNGMRTKYRRSQDLDIGLRLSKIGVKLLRKSEVLAKHHTIKYLDNKRMWKDILNGNILYKSMLYRDHLLNKNIYKVIIRNEYTLLILMFVLFLLFTFQIHYSIIIYLFIILLRSLYKLRIINIEVLNHSAYYIIKDIFTILGFFFFWRKDSNRIKFNKIR